MKILILGSGGREHALIYKIKQSPLLEKLYVIPGNGGINQDAEFVDVNPNDFPEIAAFCNQNDIGLVIVGPEAPLVDGITDFLEAQGLKVFGPSAKASAIEGSKDFMKAAAVKYGLPTAEYQSFTDADEAKQYIKEKGAPIVIKTDGLAAGKGVIIAQSEDEALTAIDEMFGGKFGDAGNKIVIEEFLEGEEASFFAICDGKSAIAFGTAQDHKRVGEGDTGLNTGGMGTYSPAPVVTDDMQQKLMDDIVIPFVEGMNEDGMPYVGVLFAGLMIDDDGNPKLLEFNIRFGDPECQVLMPRLENDIVPIMLAACEGNIDSCQAEFSDSTALCVVMAANGYPGSYEKNTEIDLGHSADMDDVIIFHAGTKCDGEKLLAVGGRVLGVTALGADIVAAQNKAYEAVDAIKWEDGFCRRDIGWRAMKRTG